MKNLPSRNIVFLFILILVLPAIGLTQDLSADAQSKANAFIEKIEEYKASNNKTAEAEQHNKLAYLYWDNMIFDKAIESFKQSLLLNREIGNRAGVKSINNNIGLIYSDSDDFENAVKYFKDGLNIARELKHSGDVYSGLVNISEALKNLSQHQEAVKHLEEALGIAQESNNVKMMRTCYGMLAENYESLGDSENTMKYFDLFSTMDKHIKSEEMKDVQQQSQQVVAQAKKELNEKETQLEETQASLRLTEELAQKRQLELELKEVSLREKEAELRSERMVRYGLTFIFIVILGFSVIIYRQFRQKKAANKQLAIQKQEIEIQRDRANKQKKDITDSIQYAKRIQTAILPPDNVIRQNLPDHFILFKPRDIVSGDFYWMMNKEDKVIIAAADCTGHGVPGAFMSMLGIAFLNEIVNKISENKHIFSLQASEILNQLRAQIIDSLHQTGDNDHSKDGIDIALCIIDYEKKKLQFAGAHNPLYLIRDGELEVIKGNRMPVSIHRNAHRPFTNHEMDLKSDDLLYIFSDGYPDQIGENGRKFLSRNFREMLVDVHKKPLDIQRQIINERFVQWRGSAKQLDDILVIGIKIAFETDKKKRRSDYDWKNHTILIAEDTEVNYIYLVEALKPTQVKIVRAKDGFEAVEIAKSNDDIDLILMDISMPRMDGFEATVKIKEFKKDLPILAQTALEFGDANERAEVAGCDDIIFKPIQLNNFLRKIDTYITK